MRYNIILQGVSPDIVARVWRSFGGHRSGSPQDGACIPPRSCRTGFGRPFDCGTTADERRRNMSPGRAGSCSSTKNGTRRRSGPKASCAYRISGRHRHRSKYGSRANLPGRFRLPTGGGLIEPARRVGRHTARARDHATWLAEAGSRVRRAGRVSSTGNLGHHPRMRIREELGADGSPHEGYHPRVEEPTKRKEPIPCRRGR